MNTEKNTDFESKGLSLLKKGQKGIVHMVFSRLGLIVLLLAIQVLLLFSIFQWFEEFLPHIFDAFAQEDGGTRTSYKGTGLGMSLPPSWCCACSIAAALTLHQKLHG